MTEAEQRRAVADEALSWQGTPYHDRADIKGVGVDCGMFPIRVYAAVGLIPADLRPDQYSPQWNLHQRAELYLGFIRAYTGEVTRETAGLGDFVVWKYGHTYSHGAIILDRPAIIHATIRGRTVHLGDMDQDEDFATRPAMFFTLWPKD